MATVHDKRIENEPRPSGSATQLSLVSLAFCVFAVARGRALSGRAYIVRIMHKNVEGAMFANLTEGIAYKGVIWPQNYQEILPLNIYKGFL